MARRRCGLLPVDVMSLLPPLERPEHLVVGASRETALVLGEELLARLPALLSPAQAAAWLGVSTETIKRRIRQEKQQAIKVLGIVRIPAESAVAQVRARVIDRLPARYKRSRRTGTAQPSTRDDASALPNLTTNKVLSNHNINIVASIYNTPIQLACN